MLNPYLSNIFCPENIVCFYTSAAFQTKQTVAMNTYQTALRVQSDLGPYCLQYRLPKKINR